MESGLVTNLSPVFSEYNVLTDVVECKPFGSGHIHDTFLVRTQSEGAYILQKINNKIFKNIPAMMGNIERVTRHLRKKLSLIPGSDPEKETLTLIHTKKNESFHLDGAGNYWRVFTFIEPHQTFDLADDPAKVKEAGKAYGRFMFLLSDLEGEPLYETIPDFHNIEMRLQKFHEALLHGNKARLKEAPDEIKLILDQAEEMTLLSRLGKEGKIPVRNTHNDTKINNILFSPEGKAMCVIDLDTVMPGFVHFDFGDAIRTFTNTAAEDEKDLSKVSMNIEFFESFASGYLSATSGMLSDEEKKHLAFSAKYFTYLHVLRFLTDYIDGDIYYKIHYPEHNLVRARNQYTLLKSMESNFSTMQKIISKLS
jgi:Ser/Thr protein kinase RdoA (MazF antagonist)